MLDGLADRLFGDQGHVVDHFAKERIHFVYDYGDRCAFTEGGTGLNPEPVFGFEGFF